MKLLAIDGNSILNRAFYGIKALTNKNGGIHQWNLWVYDHSAEAVGGGKAGSGSLRL